MTVAELQMLLSDVGKFLRASASATAAGELEYLCARLQPFAGQKLKAFADSLQPSAASATASCRLGSKHNTRTDRSLSVTCSSVSRATCLARA